MTATLNGRPQRKQLSDQLDRLDSMIDLLADGLPKAVADATREGTRAAVHDILGELLRDPEILTRLREALGGAAPAPVKPSQPSAPAPTPTVTAAPHAPGLIARVGSGLQRAAAAAVAKGGLALGTIRMRLREAKLRAGAAIETARTFVPVRRFAATAAVVGMTVAAVSYVAPQGFSAVVGGVGGAVVTAAVQTYGWLRKSARSVGLLA